MGKICYPHLCTIEILKPIIMDSMKFNNNSLFCYLPHDFTIVDYDHDEDALYTLAHNIVICATQMASALTNIPFEDFDEEREEAIKHVLEQLEWFNQNQ